MIKFGQELTEDQYKRIYFNNRTLLYPSEINEVFNVYYELTGESPCRSCPSSVQNVLDEVFGLRNKFNPNQKNNKRVK